MISHAKVNLGLRILHKRKDNYHELESIFLKISFGDEISFENTKSGKLELISENELVGTRWNEFEKVSERGDYTKNILFKTFEKMKQWKEISGLKIYLKKRIPTGGGLGGGSTNAASLIKFLYNGKFSSEFLEFAGKIGADVPFFLQNHHALVQGIGEKIFPVSIASGFGVLAVPPMLIETKTAFESLKKPLLDIESQNYGELKVSFREMLEAGNWGGLSTLLRNDFEDHAFSSFPELKVLKEEMLGTGLEFVSMTGSGSCFFGISSTANLEAKRFLEKKFSNYSFVSFSF
ncbi:MAG: 4-(cytidine 5'-diphospho)-2-C-methyl-D-erythritol kinase [Leptospiraceae bacterium]|nr:4-(cytidine 5'-diphospho)-2-C-methyl-D-erythritol kinase [Leptospiraceae bacterium]